MSFAGVSAAASAADEEGNYFLPLLTPGFYRVRVTAEQYQSNEAAEVEVSVASRIDLDFKLRPIADVWEAGQYRSVFLPGSKTLVTFFGPDVDTSRSGNFQGVSGTREALETSVSQVIGTQQLRSLPLSSRDVYGMLVTEPGVNADAGTARGLGLSVNGQRPSASNFLLDGLENNNYLLTGPLTPLAVESVQEYRISTANYSAEFGRTSGLIANAVTFSGSSAFHGIVYSYLKNTVGNANDFQRNLRGLRRVPVNELQPGFQVSGPLWKNRLTFSAGLDYFRGRSRDDPRTATLPTAAFINTLPAGGVASRLFSEYLADYAPPAPDAAGSAFTRVLIEPMSSVNRYQALGRVDYDSADHRHRVLGRVAVLDLDRPDFDFSPYPQFTSGISQRTKAFAAGYQYTVSPGLINDLRFSFSADRLFWDRARSSVPTLLFQTPGLDLPGSSAFFPYTNNNGTVQILDNVTRLRGRHAVTAGGGFLHRKADASLGTFRDGIYYFQNLEAFRNDSPSSLEVSVPRQFGDTKRAPEFGRDYRYQQFFFFLQDAVRVSRRLSLNYGVRYENFGAPRNVGATKDAYVEFGEGATMRDQLRTAKLVYPGPGDQQLFQADSKNWAGRFAFALDLSKSGRTVLRGSYGTFYDRPFDNLWLPLQNNNITRFTVFTTPRKLDYLTPIPQLLPRIGQDRPPGLGEITPPNLTIIQRDLKNPILHNVFVGIQHQIARNLTIEVNGIGGDSHRVVTTDVLNRFIDRVNDSLSPVIYYRGNQGFSTYRALTVVSRYRGSRLTAQLAYTWGHAIDNQSDPLARSFQDYGFTAAASESNRPAAANAGFMVEGDWRGDKGNADYDQRHNVVFFWIYDIPRPSARRWVRSLAGDWTVSQLAAFRSGFPFSVLDSSFNRAGLLNPDAVYSDTEFRGGRVILNRSAFSLRAFGTPGTDGSVRTGRNVFSSPGFYNLDLSVSRRFPVGWLGDAGRLTLRADAFNMLNHTNLAGPQTALPNQRFPASGRFGQALYGRIGTATGFPTLAPLNESSRTMQLVLRVEF